VTNPDPAPSSGPPAKLYKYRSMAEGETRQRTLAILEKLELYYSKASRFNDPFDCNLDIAFRSSEEWQDLAGRAIERVRSRVVAGWAKLVEAARNYAEQKGMKVPPRPDPKPKSEVEEAAKCEITIKDGEGRRKDTAEVFNRALVERMRNFYERLDKSFGVLCLSAPNDEILLWSHYANGHDGICLEFDVAGHPGAFPRLHPVAYQEAYPDIPANFPDLLQIFGPRVEKGTETLLLDIASQFAEGRNGLKAEDPETTTALAVARWFYVKSSHWQYEGEWRSLKSGPGPHSFPAQALTGVIVGCVNTEANLELIRAALKDRTPVVRLYRATRKRREFGLDIVAAE
jgi:hypothetical protein